MVTSVTDFFCEEEDNECEFHLLVCFAPSFGRGLSTRPRWVVNPSLITRPIGPTQHLIPFMLCMHLPPPPPAEELSWPQDASKGNL
jgi:hypothetical protein